jgi:hypothetical protein
MNANDFRPIFASFQNLNLLSLMDDLRAGRVLRRAFVFKGILCPIAHGLPRCFRGDLATETFGQSWHEFTMWWDGWPHDTELLSLLEGIWAERLEDADCVQGVLEREAVHVLADLC